jgi:hypothetical protein
VFDALRSLPLVLGLLAACDPATRPIAPEPEPAGLVEVVEPPKPDMAGQAQLERLASLYLNGDFDARRPLLLALSRRADEATPKAPCVPPSAEELAAARAKLSDFRVLEARPDGKLLARIPDASELDDLAYLMVAIGEAGPRVGDAWTNHASPGTDELLSELEKLQKAWDEAIRRTDLEAASVAGRRYLELLGWPGAMRTNADFHPHWSGAAHSHLMFDMAMIAEVRGEHEQARLLYTRASPVGICLMAIHRRWEDQVRGSIRTGEQLYGCRAVIAERLLDLRGSVRDDPYDYGPGRLVDAGFDLVRLYRGALLTRNRDEVSLTLAQKVVGPQREVATARLMARGSEAWESRLWALEAFTDMTGEPALDVLLELIAVGDRDTRARAITAIGQAARRDFAGPCDDPFYLYYSTARTIHAFGVDCATRLDDAEAAKLAARLRPHLHDRTPEIREATAEALELILASGRAQ